MRKVWYFLYPPLFSLFSRVPHLIGIRKQEILLGSLQRSPSIGLDSY